MRRRVALGWVALGLIVGLAAAHGCSSKDPLLQRRDAAADTPAAGGGIGTGSGGSNASGSGGGGGRLATGGTAGLGAPGSGGAGATGGAAAGGRGGMGGTVGQVSGTGGHDIAPVMCGTTFCALGSQCCQGCDGGMTCAASCSTLVCPADAGVDASDGPPVVCAGVTCGADEFCCGPPSCGTCRSIYSGANCSTLCPALDGGADAGWIPCGTGSCGPLEACVHPPLGGTCLMPDAGVCPAGTTVQGGCCLPPDVPKCVTIDRACNGPTVTCACFSKDPCGGGCASALVTGKDIRCSGA